ncbi:PEPxxWA-CTERM sorting domain-containing protein [Phenylobacterium sp.]|uniref:PEPxxWA-CTERM sorting domain-containing protein n=1 Tax=Phenylobacterium sp. TaxID=1871053 RepID=UPI00301E5D58
MIRFLAPFVAAPLAVAAILATPAAAATTVTYSGAGAPIPDNSFTLSTIEIADSFLIDDVNVSIDDLAHNFSGDVQFFLSKGDVVVQLFRNHGFNSYLRDTLTFDDAAATPITSFPLVGLSVYRPLQALEAFNGLNSAGTWTLKAVDTVSGLSGVYGGWRLELTPSVTAAVPEPGAWALMIVGFGAAGALLRQRRRAAVAA